MEGLVGGLALLILAVAVVGMIIVGACNSASVLALSRRCSMLEAQVERLQEQVLDRRN